MADMEGIEEQLPEVNEIHQPQDNSQGDLAVGTCKPSLPDDLAVLKSTEFAEVPSSVSASCTLFTDSNFLRLPFGVDEVTAKCRNSVQGQQALSTEVQNAMSEKTRRVNFKRKVDESVNKKDSVTVMYRRLDNNQWEAGILRKGIDCGQALDHFKAMHPDISKDEMTIANKEGSRDLVGQTEISQQPVENEMVIEWKREKTQP